jgi:hypothetical protein
VLDYNSLFILFSFVEGDLICPEVSQDYVPREWIGESHVVRETYLFILQIHASNFGVSQQGEMVYHFSQSDAV